MSANSWCQEVVMPVSSITKLVWAEEEFSTPLNFRV
ncbi:hypothetical protein ABIA34_005546, partial [Kitasatospora sp. MAP12-22]